MPENRKNLRKAFVALGYGDYPEIETMPFLPEWTTFYISGGIVLDIMTEMKGLESYTFDQCFERAKKADLNGVIVPFLHINELMVNKKAISLPKDLIDLIELEK